MPKEQITLKTDNLTVELYNYGQELTPSQIEEAKRVISTLSQASIPDQNSRIKYVTINNKDELNDQNGEDKRGYAFNASKMISLYPRAVSPEPHRIPDTSSFAGTLAHEIGHIYISADSDFREEWRKTFGWENLPDDQIDYKKPAPKSYSVGQPERCITEYAQFSPDEDICESLSAVVNNPAVLDAERLAFIRERWLKEEQSETATSSERKVSDDIQMPRVPDKIKYKAKVMRFSMGTIKKTRRYRYRVTSIIKNYNKTMSIEKTGEFTREEGAPDNVNGQEKSPNKQIYDIYSGIQIQNNHPSFSEKPEDVFYWKGDRLEAVRQGLATIEDLSNQSQISEVVSPYNNEERLDVKDFINKVKRSIDYSEQINEQLKTQPEVSDEEKARRKAEIRKRLMGE